MRWIVAVTLMLAAGHPLAALEAPEAPWPAFRGPHRSGTLPNATFPSRFSPGTNELWSRPVPGGHSSPVRWGDLVILTGTESNRLVTLALDATSGATRWRRELEPGRIEPGSRLSHPATATPTTDGERLVVYFAPFGLAAYDHAGAPLWSLPLPTPVTQHGASSSPVLAGDLVLQLCDQDVDSYLLAVDRVTGRERWRVERPEFHRGFSTPLPWPAAKPDSVVVAGTLRLVAYGLEEGEERWTVRGLPNELVASPVANDTRVIVAGWTPGSGVPRMPAWESVAAGDTDADGLLTRNEAAPGPARQHFHYIDANKDERLSRAEYETIARIFNESKNVAMAVNPRGVGDITDSHVTWRVNRGLPYVPCPLVYEGHVYLVKNGGLASCIDVATGEYRYQEERLGALGDYYSSPVAADGRILAISQAGVAVVFRAGPTLEILERNVLGEEVLATPALDASTLFIRTRSRLHAFREPARD